MPTSILSNTLPSKMRQKTRLCGLFFECEATTQMAASFFSQRNSILVSSSNGLTGFFRENNWAAGFFSWCKSRRHASDVSDVLAALTNSAVFSSSTTFGSFDFRYRADRAFLAFFILRVAQCDDRCYSLPRLLMGISFCCLETKVSDDGLIGYIGPASYTDTVMYLAFAPFVGLKRGTLSSGKGEKRVHKRKGPAPTASQTSKRSAQ